MTGHELAEGLLLGEEPGGRHLVEPLLQLRADGPVGVHHRMVVQVRSHTRQRHPDIHAGRAQHSGITDAGPLEHQRRAVHAARQHHRAGLDDDRSPLRDANNAHGAAVGLQPVDDHLVEDPQGAAAHRVDVGERRVPPGGAHHVHRLQTERRAGVEIAQVAGDGPAEVGGRVQAAGMERPGLVRLVGPHLHPASTSENSGATSSPRHPGSPQSSYSAR